MYNSVKTAQGRYEVTVQGLGFRAPRRQASQQLRIKAMGPYAQAAVASLTPGVN